MKKICLIILLAVICFSASGFEAGTGLSFFVPDTLYALGEGSVSVEKSLGVSLSIGPLVSIPVGLLYNTNYGLTTENKETESPWFYSDSLITYAGANLHLPLAIFYIDLFAGGAMNWNITLRALEGNIERDLSTPGAQVVFIDETLKYHNNLGFGYLLGVSAGITIGNISVGLDFLYRDIRHDLNLEGEYAILESGPTPLNFSSGTDKLIMRGISIGLSGSFKL